MSTSNAAPATPPDASKAPMPHWLWALAAAIGLLRCVPWLATYWLAAPPKSALLHMGYLPKDFLQYLAFARQAAYDAGLFATNPFTTELQDGRFLLPLFTLLGMLGGALGGPLIAWIELARIPLLLVFFAVLWRFLTAFVGPARERALVCLCIGLSGGLEVLAKPLVPWLPAEAAAEFQQATWQMSGWSTFAAAYNPLWIAGGAGLLAWLRPVLRPGMKMSPTTQFVSALGLLALFALHPYSAITAATVAMFGIALGWLLGERSTARGTLPALGAGLVGIVLLGAWQRGDAVFVASAANALGDQQLSPFWYPLVYGGLCVFAIRGAREWIRSDHPMRFALLAWLLAAVWLHTSTLLNGYHFAVALHVPLCILAAPSFVETWDRARTGNAAAIALCAVTLSAPLWLTAESIAKLGEEQKVPIEFEAIVAELQPLPPGNVLSGEKLGNVLPAYTPHRVFAGHHFLTPDLQQRGALVRDLMQGTLNADAVSALVREHRIDYAVLPTQQAARGIAALIPWTKAQRPIGRFTLLELQAAQR